tara:strand:+ start:173 stop:409 length:237 start_codon:yes stop_codon:yes gene_type:complete
MSNPLFDLNHRLSSSSKLIKEIGVWQISAAILVMTSKYFSGKLSRISKRCNASSRFDSSFVCNGAIISILFRAITKKS